MAETQDFNLSFTPIHIQVLSKVTEKKMYLLTC